jgi:ATP-dependent exoDNAse (exonuclease V) beta subunit
MLFKPKNMNKGDSIHKKSVTRILNINQESKQINFLDTRYYQRNGEYYPSVTYVLQYFPKNKYFEEWLKNVGHNSDIIAKKAADEGTQVHETIERYLKGEKISWIDENGRTNYSMEVWKMILKFADFWEKHKPTLIESEIHLFSDELKIAGTCDLVVEMNGEMWILDIKTSNSLHTSYDLQLAAYTACWNETFQEKVTRNGIIWLKSGKHGEDKSGKKIQGKGWEIYEPSRSIEDNLKSFKSVYELFKLEHPAHRPNAEALPTEIQLKS